MRLLLFRARRAGLALLVLLAGAGGLRPVRGDVPAGPPAPFCDIAVVLDVAGRQADVRQRVTWVNPGPGVVGELCFNAHAHYQLPRSELLSIGKMLELVRVAPSEAIDRSGPALDVRGVDFLSGPGWSRVTPLSWHFGADQTTLSVPLPRSLAPGESVSVDLHLRLRLPARQGRWGQWRGVTFLTGCLPALAPRGPEGWRPTPLVPWYQAQYQEAALYRVRARVPHGQVFVCTAGTPLPRDVGDGQEYEVGPLPARDFALLCSDRYQEFTDQVGSVMVRCVAFPEHAPAARRMLCAARLALTHFAEWFGPYPYSEFVIAETYLGWNARSCPGLAMIDARVFALPAVSAGYAEYLVVEQVAQQWWGHLVGTNEYAEAYLSAGLSSHLAHRLLDRAHGRDSQFFHYPRGLNWLPNVGRDDFRSSLLDEYLARGEGGPAAQEVPHFEEPARLAALAAGRGGKVFGMIEARLGEDAFLALLHDLAGRYAFGVLTTVGLRHELEERTGRSWEDFFRNWVYGAGLTDWCVEKVTLAPRNDGTCLATVLLQQKGEVDEPTVLGVRLKGEDGYSLRLPIDRDAGTLEWHDPPARVEPLPDVAAFARTRVGRARVLANAATSVRVVMLLPARPAQITVDPDRVLLDRDPANNTWKPEISFHLSPLYTFLDETSLTCAHDRLNVLAGLWYFDPSYGDPWFMRATVLGPRLGLYQAHQLQGGVYGGLRPDYRDLAYGADLTLPNWPFPKAEVGFNIERSLARLRPGGAELNRAVLYGRYIFDETASFYLPPMQYLEAFAANQNDYLPLPRTRHCRARRFDTLSTVGAHYHLDLLTPYWDPEYGVKLDGTVAGGLPVLGQHSETLQGIGQVSVVQSLPEELGWFGRTRLALRLYGATALPDHAQLFSLGGSLLFRGFDLRERQGSDVWVGSAEWRVPLLENLDWSCGDGAVALHRVSLAPFYDAGNAYLGRHPVGPIAHAVGCGLRLDVSWLGFLERTTLRFDFARAINASTPPQFWFGIQHPF